MIKEIIPPCAGFVLIRKSETNTSECLLVQTPQGHWGFPKGKRHRKESVLDNALRELYEETGISKSQICIHDEYFSDESSAKGNLAVRYLFATLSDLEAVTRLLPEEHSNIEWIPVDQALKILRPSRREVLQSFPRENF